MSMTFESWLHGQWAERGAFAWALSPLSLLFMAISRARMRRIKPVEIPVPVVVVGNIYVGGTGKTPITIQLVRELRNAGWTPGVVSRGYGRKSSGLRLVTQQSLASDVGDEPLLIALSTDCPVAVGSDRVCAAKMLLAQHPEINVIVSDDGLQHVHLARDVELAVVGARGLGNGWVLPAGPLREPPSRLDSVDAIILNATQETVTSRTPRFAATSQVGEAVQLCSGKRRDIDDLSHRIAEKEAKCWAAAGIAAPGRFFDMLRAHDLNPSTLDLGDHFGFEHNPFAHLECDYIFITGKDAVKCRSIPEIANDERIWVVDLEMHLDPFLTELVLEKITKAAQHKKSAVPEFDLKL